MPASTSTVYVELYKNGTYIEGSRLEMTHAKNVASKVTLSGNILLNLKRNDVITMKMKSIGNSNDRRKYKISEKGARISITEKRWW